MLVVFGLIWTLPEILGTSFLEIPFVALPVDVQVLIFVLFAIVYLPLRVLNRHILVWRLDRKQDIIEAEKYESERRFSRLRPKQPGDQRDNWPDR